MDIFLLYLVTRIPVWHSIAIAVTIIAAVVLAVTLLELVSPYNAEKEAAKKFLPKVIPTVVIALLCIALIPSQKDLGLILAGWAVIEVPKTETACRLASKSVQVIEQHLDSFLKQEK